MYSNRDILEIIEEENLSYAIIEGVSPSRIRDTILVDLWEEARELLIRIQEHLDNNMDDEDEFDFEDD